MEEKCITKEELIIVLESFLREVKNDHSLISFNRSFRTFDVGHKIIGTEIYLWGRKYE